MLKAKPVLVLLALATCALRVSSGDTPPAPQFDAAQPMALPEFKADAYPSLVLYDVDKDGKPELITSGVRGRLTVSKRSAPDALKWIDHKPWLDVDGKQIDFHNW